MKTSSKELVKVVVVSIVVMLTLPAAYRIWRAYHPQSEQPRRTLMQLFGRSSEDKALRLLKTPLAKWTESERRSAPKVRAWLEAHEKTVLPWEWTEEARRKDPAGYRRAWIGLFEEQVSDLKSHLRSQRGRLVVLECGNWISGVFRTDRTNRLERVRTGQAMQDSVKAIAVSLEEAEKTLDLLERSEGLDDERCQKEICRLIDLGRPHVR